MKTPLLVLLIIFASNATAVAQPPQYLRCKSIMINQSNQGNADAPVYDYRIRTADKQQYSSFENPIPRSLFLDGFSIPIEFNFETNGTFVLDKVTIVTQGAAQVSQDRIIILHKSRMENRETSLPLNNNNECSLLSNLKVRMVFKIGQTLEPYFTGDIRNMQRHLLLVTFSFYDKTDFHQRKDITKAVVIRTVPPAQ